MRRSGIIFIALAGCLLLPAASGQDRPQAADPAAVAFTGEILPVLYVTDVLRSVEFYRAAGFEFHHFFDYDAGEQVQTWTSDAPPIWAEMAAGSQAFGLHRVAEGRQLAVDGVRHYFLVEDVDAHYSRVKSAGVEVGKLIDRPWMRMFGVRDPDGHDIWFGTRK